MPKRKRKVEKLKICQVVSIEDQINSLKSGGSEEQKWFLENGGWNLLHNWIQQSVASEENSNLLLSIVNLIVDLPTISVLDMLKEKEPPIISSLQAIFEQSEPKDQIEKETRQLCLDLLLKWHFLIEQNITVTDKKDTVVVEATKNPPSEQRDTQNDCSWEKNIRNPLGIKGKGIQDKEKESNSSCQTTSDLPEKNSQSSCRASPQQNSSTARTVIKPQRRTRMSKKNQQSAMDEDAKREELLKRVIVKVKKYMEKRREYIRKCKVIGKEPTNWVKKRRLTPSGADDNLEDVTIGTNENQCKIIDIGGVRTAAPTQRNIANAYFSDRSRTERLMKVMEKTVPVYPQQTVARISHNSVTSTQKRSLVTSSTQTIPVLVLDMQALPATLQPPFLSLPSVTKEQQALSTVSSQQTVSSQTALMDTQFITTLTQPPTASRELVLWKPLQPTLQKTMLSIMPPPPPAPSVPTPTGLQAVATKSETALSKIPVAVTNAQTQKDDDDVLILERTELPWKLQKIRFDDRDKHLQMHRRIRSCEKVIQEKRMLRVSRMRHPEDSLIAESPTEPDLEFDSCPSQSRIAIVLKNDTFSTKVRDRFRKKWPEPCANDNVNVIQCFHSLGKGRKKTLKVEQYVDLIHQAPCQHSTNTYAREPPFSILSSSQPVPRRPPPLKPLYSSACPEAVYIWSPLPFQNTFVCRTPLHPGNVEASNTILTNDQTTSSLLLPQCTHEEIIRFPSNILSSTFPTFLHHPMPSRQA